MATAIKRINIYEQDLTTAARAEDSLDVVYIPGLFGVSSIATEEGVTPPEGRDQAGFDSWWNVGDRFCNIADKRMWVCKSVKIEPREATDEAVTSETTDTNSTEEASENTVLDTYIYSWREVTYVEPKITDPAEYTEFTMLPPELYIDAAKFTEAYGASYRNEIVGNDSNTHSHQLGSSVEYALGIINAGLPVLYHCGVKYEEDTYDDIDGTPICTFYQMTATADDILSAMEDEKFFEPMLDYNDFEVKFITTGAHAPVIWSDPDDSDSEDTYPQLNKTVILNMIKAAATRGDALAMIDGWDEQSVSDTKTDLYTLLTEAGPWKNGEYAAAFAPWAHYVTTTSTDVLFPASYGYLIAYANSIKTNGSALAIAGVTRGRISDLKSLSLQPTEKLSNAIADSWQDIDSSVCVNGITYIRNYGYCLWGNRTLHDNSEETGSNGLVDTSFLSIRVMLCDLKKRLRNIAVRLLFEQNNDVLWGKFLFGVVPVLERLKGIAAISNYKIIHVPTDDKTKLKAVIKLTTVKPLEQIEIGIVMVDDVVEVQ